jgi:hypothetical protein
MAPIVIVTTGDGVLLQRPDGSLFRMVLYDSDRFWVSGPENAPQKGADADQCKRKSPGEKRRARRLPCSEVLLKFPDGGQWMFKKLLSLWLITLLINLAAMTPAYAASKEEKQTRFAEKVKASVLKLGTGEAAHVKIKLQDETKLAGYISAADGERFTVIDRKTGTATTIAYAQVKSVQGHNLSTGAKIAIGAGIAAAIIFITLGFTTGPGSD